MSRYFLHTKCAILDIESKGLQPLEPQPEEACVTDGMDATHLLRFAVIYLFVRFGTGLVKICRLCPSAYLPGPWGYASAYRTPILFGSSVLSSGAKSC